MLNNTPAWQALARHRHALEGVHMRDLFTQDPDRFDKFNLKLSGLLFDYSKHRITEETLSLLLDLARQANVTGWRDRMFQGDKINTTEDRAVLHTALRCPKGDKVMVDGENITNFRVTVKVSFEVK